MAGRCPHCRHLKDPSYAPPPTRLNGGSEWPDNFMAYVGAVIAMSVLGGAACLALGSLL